MLSMALQEALTKLKQQERATAARAEASERLASQIVEGLTSGLVVVDRSGVVQSVNPAARRILDLESAGIGAPFRELLASAPALSDVIGEALQGGVADCAPHDRARPRQVAASRRHRVADYGRRRIVTGGRVPVHRPHRGGAARRAAAPQGSAGAAGRADRGPRARVPQRPGDHSRLRPAARSGNRCPIRRAPVSKASAPRRPRWAKSSPTS